MMKLKFGEFYYIKEYQYLPNEYFSILRIKDYDAEERDDWIRIKNASIVEVGENSIYSFIKKHGEVKFNIDKEELFDVTITSVNIDQFTDKLSIELKVEKPTSLSTISTSEDQLKVNQIIHKLNKKG